MSLSFHKSETAGNKVSSSQAACVMVIKLKKRGQRTAAFKTEISILEGDALHGCAGNKLTGMGKSQQHGELMQLIC